jgi:glycosyltransferase involved in cell wall biosynthesis
MQRLQPSICCICLTGYREAFLRRAIKCFLSQTYRNKTLLIVYPAGDSKSRRLIQEYAGSGIRSLELKNGHGMLLGELRNYAIANCNADYFCQWDDDDWSHSQRLEQQMNAIQHNFKSASILGHWLLYNNFTKSAYVSYYGAWAGSILCKTDLINPDVCYPALNTKEDSEFVKKLFKINCLMPVISASMYIYIFHGKNTWQPSHFDHFFKFSKPLSRETSEIVTAILNGDLSNEEGSAILISEKVQKEIDYFYFLEPEEEMKPIEKPKGNLLTRILNRRL